MSKSTTPSTVLVTGATGKQGGAVARHLLTHGHRVRGLTRHPESDAAAALKAAGAEIAGGDFLDRASLDRALAGVDAVFAMGTPFESGPDAEVRQGVALTDAARAARVRHFLYTSVANADRQTGIPHFESKRRVEEHLASSDLPHTILAPVYFMENALAPWTLPALKRNAVERGLPAQRKLQQVAIADLAALATAVLERPAEHRGKRIDVASDEITGLEEVTILSKVLGRPIEYREVPLAQIRAQSEDLFRMLDWFDRVGYSADIPGLRRAYPEIGWHTLESWARAQDWSAAQAAQK